MLVDDKKYSYSLDLNIKVNYHQVDFIDEAKLSQYDELKFESRLKEVLIFNMMNQSLNPTKRRTHI